MVKPVEAQNLKVGVLTCSQLSPPPNLEDAIATMRSLSTLNLPHAPRPTSKKVPYRTGQLGYATEHGQLCVPFRCE